MLVCTSTYGYKGPDRLDTTAHGLFRARIKGLPFPGEPFAPPWWAVAAALGIPGPPVPAANLPVPQDPEERWVWYRDLYVSLMRRSWSDHRAAWADLLARERVVLVCFCKDRSRCHRGVLAELLVQAGATDGGEVSS